jgi:hypothetical protein
LCRVDGCAKEVAGLFDRFSNSDPYTSSETRSSDPQTSMDFDCTFDGLPSRSEVREGPVSQPLEYVALVS